MRLPCDNLQDFVNGIRHYYTVYEGDYQEGDTVILYNHHEEYYFKVRIIIRYPGRIILGLVTEEVDKKISSYYSGTNPLD